MLKSPNFRLHKWDENVYQNIGKPGTFIFNIERAVLLTRNPGCGGRLKTECVIFLDIDGIK